MAPSEREKPTIRAGKQADELPECDVNVTVRLDN